MSEALGPMDERTKTDMRLPKELIEAIDRVCASVGVKKNAFFVLSAAYFCASLAPMLKHPKRGMVLREVEKLFQKVMDEARKES